MSKYNCFTCNYIFSNRSNMNKHMQSTKHLSRVNNEDELNYVCKVCNKKYKCQSGLWKHNQKCKVVNVDAVTELRIEMKEMVKEMVKELMVNQQPSIVTSNNNNNNITNMNINFFLNTVCKNACSIEEFINKIDYENINFHNILKNYEDGNLEVISKTFFELPENERPLYCFEGDEGKAYIKYNKEWIMEDEKSWEDQIEREQEELDDEPIGKSMYDLVRMFDKRKVVVFHSKWRGTHVYLYENKIDGDCYKSEKQLSMVKKLIAMATIPKPTYCQ